MTIRVQVEGLAELQRALRRADTGLARTVTDAVKAAAQPVVDDARRRVPTGPPAGGHARNSIRVVKSGRTVEVRGGGARYPYYMWLEFGGHVGRKHHTYRNRVKGGRYIYPAATKQRGKIGRAVNRIIVRHFRSSNLPIREGR